MLSNEHSVTAANVTIRALLDAQRQAFVAAGAVSADERKARLQSAIDMLVKYNDLLCAAMDKDFGGRSAVFSMMNDILGALASLKHAREHLADWMPQQARPSVAPFDNFGATAWVRYQPKGVVGIIGTWNAPVFTLLSPLASVFAAGNRAILKPSEIAPATAEVMATAVAEFFAPEVLTVVNGDSQIAAAFSEQAWNHLVFTGSTGVGKAVMQAASANLVPVTLELGGKSPVLIGRSADIRNAAERITVGKGANSGQLCVSPDVVWVAQDQLEPFIAAVREFYEGLFPRIGANPDVVAIVNERHFKRVAGYIDDARSRGARVETAGSGEPHSTERRMPLQLVVNPPADSLIATHEIFGPALVINTYAKIDDAIAAVNAGERPLALYYFGDDAAEEQRVLDQTLSGGVSINDVTMHPALHDAPFGGVGASGIGHYHGHEGFLEFSHARSVYKAGQQDPRREWGMLPPYSEQFEQMLRAGVNP
ncbi:coniferyl-aldehyde dehydrogenase [Collimonas sp. OK607]|uniref:coniferyl aldehyde dehydrogenase n=1 Tax=Collimonas sp. OK607 TaxID=1798194 RepID=UPI0008E7BFDD|nr:coniferyl aldehyde dehydrogenase [Collimonas sp. OK607]SFA82173.1 coniferyl-aldehyde dehydrogenase [Collimonas sp. OK607]